MHHIFLFQQQSIRQMKMQFMVQWFAGQKVHFESYSMTSLIPIGKFPQPKPVLTGELTPIPGVQTSAVFLTLGALIPKIIF